MLEGAILTEFGTETLRAICRSTSAFDGGCCLDTALVTHAGITRGGLEERTFAFESPRP